MSINAIMNVNYNIDCINHHHLQNLFKKGLKMRPLNNIFAKAIQP